LKKLTVLFATALLAMAAPSLALEEGARAPSFSAPRLDSGDNLSLSSYRGKVVLVDFWASWCAPCLVSLPLYEELRKELPASDFQVLAVNLDREPKAALRFIQERGVGFPSVADPKGRIPEIFGLETMPTSYLIDRNGRVRYVHEGFRRGDIDELREKAKALLAEKAS
jgi:thiol-disulfide isomerase/thioredoxin